MTHFIQTLISSLSLGSIYALIALGYTMVYGIAKMLNFAHGDIIMVGAYTVIVAAFQLGMPPALAALMSILVCVLLGVLIERLAYKPLRQAPPLSVLITAIGVSYLLQNLALIIFGSEQKAFPALITLPELHLGAVVVDGITLVTLAATAVIMVGLTLFINKTRIGKALRAVSEDKEAAELMKPIFLEIIMAPKFDEGALEVLSAKKNLRLLEVSMDKGDVDPKQYVSVNGGLLVQDLDVATKAVTADMCVTKAKPAAEQMEDLNFGWHIVKHVKSNAIVAVKDGRTLGVGAGQMNRIGSAEIALKQAHAAGVTEGLVLASDGFFPFDDCVTLAAEYGVTAIVQPGGSVRDEDSIRKADEKGIAMVFTGERHFKH